MNFLESSSDPTQEVADGPTGREARTNCRTGWHHHLRLLFASTESGAASKPTNPIAHIPQAAFCGGAGSRAHRDAHPQFVQTNDLALSAGTGQTCRGTRHSGRKST